MGESANFVIVARECDRETITLRDIGPHDKYLTITNDIEGVISRLQKNGMLWRKRRLFYYDSEDEFVEVKVSRGKFQSFMVGRR